MTGDQFRDDMRVILDDVRDSILDDCFGRRLHTYIIRTRTWSGTEVGDGTFTVSDLVPTPRPRYMRAEPNAMSNLAGRFEDGDIVIGKVSARSYTAAQLGDPNEGQPHIEVFWIIDGDQYFDVIGTEIRYGEWRVHLRQRRGI